MIVQAKNLYVTDLITGMEVTELFLLANAQQSQAKNGPYWRLELRDRTGSITGKIWSPQSLAYPDLAAGQFIIIKGRVSTFRDSPELTIEHLETLAPADANKVDAAQFMQASLTPPAQMMERLQALCQQHMTHAPWQAFTELVLHDAYIAPRLLVAPAAKSMHHAYLGGLLEHTLSVAELAMGIARHYHELDKQVLLAGAICHDLGKIEELSSGLLIEYTQPGKMLGHIFLGLERLTPLMHQAQLEPELIEHLQHLIISHHGTLEFGSPKLPATAEAIVLHYADNIDAKLQQVRTALDGLDESSHGWSNYIPALERSLFKAMPSPAVHPTLEQEESASQQHPDEAVSHSTRQTSKKKPPAPLVSQCSLLSKE